MVQWAQLESKGNPNWKLSFGYTTRALTIGRAQDAALVLPDMHISGKHVTFTLEFNETGERQISMTDTSTNGTWLNGNRVTARESIVLKHGDTVNLPCEEGEQDNFTFTFVLANPSGEGSSNTADTMSQKEVDKWKRLFDVQEKVAVESSRLAATLYAQHDSLREQGSISTVNDLKESNENLKAIIQFMVNSFRQTSIAVANDEEIPETVKQRLISQINADKYETMLHQLL